MTILYSHDRSRSDSVEVAHDSRLLSRIAALLGALALIGGTASLLGWFLDIYRLTDWSGAGISMKANAAIATLSAGLALMLLSLRPQVAFGIRCLGILVAVIGGLTLFEHISGLSLGIDN